VVLESIEEGQYEPRRAITSLRSELHAALKAIDHDDGTQGQFSEMVADMAGGADNLTDSYTIPENLADETAPTPTNHGVLDSTLPLSSIPLNFRGDDSFSVDFASPTHDWA
jgi:hypothetical protein